MKFRPDCISSEDRSDPEQGFDSIGARQLDARGLEPEASGSPDERSRYLKSVPLRSTNAGTCRMSQGEDDGLELV